MRKSGKTFVNKRFPGPFQKTLILSSSPVIPASTGMTGEEDREFMEFNSVEYNSISSAFFMILLSYLVPQSKFGSSAEFVAIK